MKKLLFPCHWTFIETAKNTETTTENSFLLKAIKLSSLWAYPEKNSVETIIFILLLKFIQMAFSLFPASLRRPPKLDKRKKALKQKDRIISMPDLNQIDIKITQNNVLKIQFMTILFKTSSSLARFLFSSDPHSITAN